MWEAGKSWILMKIYDEHDRSRDNDDDDDDNDDDDDDMQDNDCDKLWACACSRWVSPKPLPIFAQCWTSLSQRHIDTWTFII